MLDESEQISADRRDGADNYAKEVLYALEERISTILSQVRSGLDLLDDPNESENENITMVENSNGGRKEARGIWAWRLDTLNPGTSTTISVSLSGLSKGDWTDTDIFFRGNGDIIGATKIDEKILEEIRKSEALTAIRNEISESESQEVNEVVSERELVEKEETNNSDGINIFADFEEGSE